LPVTISRITLVGPASSVAPDPPPLEAVPLVPVPLSEVPLVAAPLDAIPLVAVPLAEVPLETVPLVAVPLEPVPVDAVPLVAVPLSEVPLDPVAADIVPVPALVEPVVVVDDPLADDWDPVPAFPSVGELDPQAHAKAAMLPSASPCRCFTFALSLVDGAMLMGRTDRAPTALSGAGSIQFARSRPHGQFSIRAYRCARNLPVTLAKTVVTAIDPIQRDP
jgi:hypothetical protein